MPFYVYCQHENVSDNVFIDVRVFVCYHSLTQRALNIPI